MQDSQIKCVCCGAEAMHIPAQRRGDTVPLCEECQRIYNSEPPCRHCEERSMTCHQTCERYLTWSRCRSIVNKAIKCLVDNSLFENRHRLWSKLTHTHSRLKFNDQ